MIEKSKAEEKINVCQVCSEEMESDGEIVTMGVEFLWMSAEFKIEKLYCDCEEKETEDQT